MHAPATRVFPPVTLAARLPRAHVQRRAFFSWPGGPPPPSRNGSDGGSTDDGSNGSTGSSGGSDAAGKGSVTEQSADSQPDPQAATDTAGGRSRSHVGALQRGRQAQKRAAASLPPVKLPPDFLIDNVTVSASGFPPELPTALAHDAKTPKVSTLYKHPNSTAFSADDLEEYFQMTFDVLLELEAQMVPLLRHVPIGANTYSGRSLRPIGQLLRCWDMIIDSAWHLTDALYPARQAEYTYGSRPFWWWDIYGGLRDPDRRRRDVVTQRKVLSIRLKMDLWTGANFEHSFAHAIADLPTAVFRSVSKAIERDMLTVAPRNFDVKTSKRQVTVLALTGYSGQSIPQAFGKYVAHEDCYDLVQLDAYTLSVLVGDYLGQNWAYSRGPLSMLGFRAAELNGKLAQDPDVTSRSADEEDVDSETAYINVRASPGQLDEELQKIKQGSYECFSKWDNLKIDKILNEIIRTPADDGKSHGKVIQIHDFVELNMTLEGAWLIGRLRALVDMAWQQGEKIVILGTSSSELPSDDYQSMVRDLAVEDLVISRHLQPAQADDRTHPEGQFSLQTGDILVENIQNINRMIRAIDPDLKNLYADPAYLLGFAHTVTLGLNPIQDSILPVTEVYNLAMAYRQQIQKRSDDTTSAFLERMLLGKLREKPSAALTSSGLGKFNAPDQPKASEEMPSDRTASAKLTEYEKRISTGQINRENLKTTFADVHAPPETISALKLLTSLALTRPEAFSYGVLASDKIPGCLLYGPPGTGKTMLAKAVAKDSGATMLEISGATINDKWVGEGEKLIRAVFTLAKKLSPCVVFIDEADALLGSRNMFSRSSHRELLNQFLKEWDGIQETNAFIMVATNRPFDLDDAVLRRLPRKILVDLPLRDDRAAILKLLLRDEALDPSVSLEAYAERTPFYSGSDLKNVCVAAAMAAVQEETEAAAKHTGSEPYQYPQKRILRSDHFELALKEIPASISEDMVSLKQIRKFDEDYGRQRKGAKKSFGFGILEDLPPPDSGLARIRQKKP